MNRLNNKGQTLIMFIILIPVTIMLMALIVDSSYLYIKKTKLENTTANIIENLYLKKDDENIIALVEELYNKNDIQTKKLKVDIQNDYFKISNEYKIDSIFGSIIGLKKYDVKVSLKGYYENDKVKVIKE